MQFFNESLFTTLKMLMFIVTLQKGWVVFPNLEYGNIICVYFLRSSVLTLESNGPGAWHSSNIFGQQCGQSLSLLARQIYKKTLVWPYLNVVSSVTSSLDLISKDRKDFILFSLFGSIYNTEYNQSLLC